jgi:lipoprotein-releasing system ATP-binding protein
MQDLTPILSAVNLHKTYRKYAQAVPVLRGVNLDVHQGDFLSVLGASGSGKSTMLHLLGLLDGPDLGRIHYEGRRVDNLPRRERDQLRNGTFGFIFQFYHLLPELNALENVLSPAMIKNTFRGWWGQRAALRQRATELLGLVGLGHRLKHKPRELSGGELQRAAIARALINQPRILFADEPTGNLDGENGAHIMQLLRDLNRHEGVTIVMVTHNLDLIADTDRVIRLTDGQVDGEGAVSCQLSVASCQHFATDH